MENSQDIIGVVREVEEWRPIKDWEAYEISSFGRVRSLHRGGRIRKPHIKMGYAFIDLWMHGKCKHFTIHRLVLWSFGPPQLPGFECNHKDGVKLNNHIDNLEWVTRSYNQIHAIKMGLANPERLSYFKKGHTPWNKQKDRTCQDCGKPNSIKSNRKCTKCYQRWKYGKTGLTKKEIQKLLLDQEARLRRYEEALEELKQYPRGTKCTECGYRLVEHRADIARVALSPTRSSPTT